MLDQLRVDEEGRVAALQRYEVLDTPSEKPFDKITSLVQSIMDVPICAVSLVDRERQWFKSIQGLDVAETPRSISFCTHTIQTDQPFIVKDAKIDERFRANPLVVGPPNIGSYAGVPLKTPEGYNVGALCVIDTVPREFTDTQIGILSSFAALVVDELELRRIAGRDHMTGALTRRGFSEQLAKGISLFHRHRRDSVLVMLDIDHFKTVNDRFGHPAGDEVLKAVSAVCKQQLRTSDAFGRLGGEEFGIFLADTKAAGAWIVAEKIRRAIEDVIVEAGHTIQVTASLGLAQLSTEISSYKEWISAADEALYAAKHQGRNRCVQKSQQAHSGLLT